MVTFLKQLEEKRCYDREANYQCLVGYCSAARWSVFSLFNRSFGNCVYCAILVAMQLFRNSMVKNKGSCRTLATHILAMFSGLVT